MLDSAGLADVLEELAVDGEVDADAALSTIFIGTRRRLGNAVVDVDAFVTADVAADAPLSGGEATSMGVRFCDVSHLSMTNGHTASVLLHTLPRLSARYLRRASTFSSSCFAAALAGSRTNVFLKSSTARLSKIET